MAQVGALFAGTSDGGIHFCTASVVHSPARDLLVTAAHCVSGTGAQLVFVPMYHDGLAPFGSWDVREAYVTPGWMTTRDPREDVAFLAVTARSSPAGTTQVEDAVGADRLVTSRGYAVRATVVGYPVGTAGRPITCTNQVHDHAGYPTFDCGGFVDGTSGSPWITGLDRHSMRGDLYGVIGGLEQGGCTPSVSYSSYFDSAVMTLYHRATRGGPGDVVPTAGAPGC